MRKMRTTLILIGLLAVFVPACVFAGNIGQEGTKSLLTGTAVQGDHIYVMGTYDSSRLWVNKYSKDDIDTPLASWSLEEGPGIQYWAGGDAYNGAIAVDENGNVYVGAVRGTGYSRQMMVYRLDPDLEKADSACFGTTETDNPGGTYKNPEIRDIAVSSGNIYIAGDLSKTEKKGLDAWREPVCPFEKFKKNQSEDQEAGRRIGFVVSLNNNMDLQKCTYMGCGSDGNAAIAGLMCDSGELYIIGKDASGNIPTTDGVIQREINRTSSYSDSFDAFIMRMDGETLESKIATYYGGTGSEEVADMKLVGQNLYVYGDTTSDDLPLSEGAYSTQRASSSGFYPGAYVLRLHKTMKRTDSFAATYFGDANSNRIDAFSMDAAGGRVYLTGKTGLASSIPVTDGSTKGHIFIASMSGDLSALHSATVLGSGGAGDYGRGIVCLGDQIYLSGTWGSDAMIDTKTLQPFIMKIKDDFAHAALTWIGMKTFVNDVQNYGTGQTIEIKLTFDSNVEVTGTPKLKLNIQNGEVLFREAEYAAGSGSKDLIFTYTVREGDTTGGNRLTTYGDEPFDLSEGNISPWASTEGERADLTMPAGSDNRLEYAAGDRVYVDGKPAGSGEEGDDQGKTDDKPSVTPAKDINAITPADTTANSAKVSKSIPKVNSSKLATTVSIAKKKMTLKWVAVKGATNYRIAYKTAKATKWNYKWSAGKRSAVFTKLSRKGLYQYKVAVYKKIGDTWFRSEYTGIQYRYIASTSRITAKAKGKKKVKVTWKKQKGASGYQVIYSLKKNMKGAKVKNVKGGAKKTVTLKKLKKGKRYYVQVRPYKTYKGKMYIGVVNGKRSVRVK